MWSLIKRVVINEVARSTSFFTENAWSEIIIIASLEEKDLEVILEDCFFEEVLELIGI